MTEAQKQEIERCGRFCESHRRFAFEEMAKPDGDPDRVAAFVGAAGLFSDLAFKVAQA